MNRPACETLSRQSVKHMVEVLCAHEHEQLSLGFQFGNDVWIMKCVARVPESLDRQNIVCGMLRYSSGQVEVQKLSQSVDHFN